MRKSTILLLCLLFSGLVSLLPSSAATTLGPFLPNPAFSLYLISDGKPVSARLTIRRGPRAEGDRVMVRAFNAQEQLTFWQYVEPGKMADTFGPGDMEVWGIPLQIPVKPQPGDLLMDTELHFDGSGVHQLRITAGAGNVLVSLTLPRPLAYGVSFQNGNYAAWEGQPATMYAYVPPHAEELQVTGGLVTIADAAGKELARTEDASLQKWVTIPVTQTDALWTVKFPQVNNWLLRAAGFPFILCPTPEAAKTIRASVEVLPDGTVVCHKFQRRIAELLPKLLDPKNVGKAENLIVPLASRKEAWLADPVRNENLLNPYALMPSIAYALRSQNVDPQSHWSGAIEGWQDLQGKPAPGNRWDRLRSVPGIMRAGASPSNNAIEENLAKAALLDTPCNPYFGKKELLYRAAAAALRDLMMLGEDEVWRGCDADQSAYPGMMGFSIGQKTLPVFALVAPLMPDDVRAVWSDAVRHIIDRSYPDNLVTCRNQSSHYLTAYQEFATGSGDAHYLELTRAYARRFVQGAHPAGFYIEQCGPDASYIGMTHWHMAMYYRESQDPTILEGLRRSYRFFNHTVAPEPDGKMLGGFNFNHRIATGFYDEQWGGAKGILDDVLPEVGLWAGPALSPEKQAAKVQQAATNITKQLA
ncbi:MAG TPA: hypothetical protein VGL77_21750, partial [Armatimonadota bacterium]